MNFGPYPFEYRNDKGDERFNPLFTMHRALTLYNAYLKHKSKRIETVFFEAADSLVERLVAKKDLGVWLVSTASLRTQMYRCEIPFASALLQGQGISSLVRAYSLVKDPKYLTTAQRALKAFQFQMKDDGVLSVDKDDGHWWYEEYASPSADASGVLNGFIFGLMGMYDYYLLTDDDFSKRLFDEGVRTLCHHIKDFDTHNPSMLTYYDRQSHIVTLYYHLLHLKQMEILFNITGKKVFREYKTRWQRYANEWLAHRRHRLLHKFYYIKSGNSLTDSARLIRTAVSDRIFGPS